MSAARPERGRWSGGLLAIVLGSLIAHAPAADSEADPDRARARLEALQERISAIETRLGSARQEESQLSQDLSEVETELSRTTRQLAGTRRDLQAGETRLQDLRGRRHDLQSRLETHREGLHAYLRTAYMLGRHETLKLLLNQEDPQRLGRVLTYYRYLSEARAAAMEQVRDTLTELAGVETAITEQVSALNRDRDRIRSQQQRLQAQYDERTQLLAQLRDRIRTDTDRLARLEEDEARLQRLIAELRAALADVQQLDRQRRPFARMKAELPWPAAGELAHRFGERRGLGDLRWRGVFIAAPAEAPISSISHGRVAFADWLRGFGLLIILDHGDGYMSLYGHTRALFKDVGDWVEDGEVIAQVGNSGGADDTGLYFELRHNGEPIDPLQWCAGRPTALQAAAH